ncbi:hypothetical protein GGR51DRAFT_200965 [Nemania sp. FL0031]|nr:hypothetical protein GGR51DRAFT_200965 [Nemania sp. FL0031]
MHIHNFLTTLPLLTLVPPASTHAIPLPQPQSCPSHETPQSFTLSSITYLRYEVSPPFSSPQPNTTQLVFELASSGPGISTGCAVQNVMAADGHWADDSSVWQACVERSITVGGRSYPVKTSAHFDWDAWRLSVNQTWACDESVTISQFSALTLAPSCTENKTGSQYIKECTAPDVVISATSGNT